MVVGLSQLESLDLSESEVEVYDTTLCANSTSPSYICTYVHMLCVSFQQISDSGIRQAAFHCPLLVSVNLSGCPLVSSSIRTYIHLWSACINLWCSHFACCCLLLQVTDTSVKYLAQGCSHLNSLDLSQCSVRLVHTLTCTYLYLFK